MPGNIQRAYRRRLQRLEPKENAKGILVAGGKAAAAVFSSVLGSGSGGNSGSTAHLARLTGTARTTALGINDGVARLTNTARSTVMGVGANRIGRTTLVMKTVSRRTLGLLRETDESRKRLKGRLGSTWTGT